MPLCISGKSEYKDLDKLSLSTSACVRRDISPPVLLESKTWGIFVCSERPLADRPFSEEMVPNI